jgi:hypothetical protein
MSTILGDLGSLDPGSNPGSPTMGPEPDSADRKQTQILRKVKLSPIFPKMLTVAR